MRIGMAGAAGRNHICRGNNYIIKIFSLEKLLIFNVG